ncbi:uncharacterized protein LOC111703770 isoform X2 [Eurytemora carolleeae]|uniref:uncharacterized protein LOC111703770 isoform X2 n=1 Tax=Eurytemora carolleeae TaxID=1294199 RepID=UPI000C7849CC|nr:uncharacterized protein LOC111703770 isoform X2 [Eurytemora carolleeae]|eukprot:XP_023331583.1 uncharacterized protein LOC111703770 isoform X2 [Eurytemora affinis]
MSLSLKPFFNMPCQLTVIEPRRTSSSRSNYHEIEPRRVGSRTSLTNQALIFNGNIALTRLVTTLTEWLVILQGVAEDRECDRPNVKCRCCKAAKIQEELRLLASKLNNAQQICSRVGMIGEDVIDEISLLVQNLATMLRSEVSILIPTLGRADPMVAEQARWLVQDNETKNCASEAVEGVITLVVRLLGVESCLSCKPSQSDAVGGWGEGVRVEEEGDVDMDILNLVAGMCSGYPEPLVPAQTNKEDEENTRALKEKGLQVWEKSRKRKQPRPVRHPSPSSTSKSRKVEPLIDSTSSSILQPQPNVVHLLEKKKKGVKKDGLYKFVLWREALRDEKAKNSD